LVVQLAVCISEFVTGQTNGDKGYNRDDVTSSAVGFIMSSFIGDVTGTTGGVREGFELVPVVLGAHSGKITNAEGLAKPFKNIIICMLNMYHVFLLAGLFHLYLEAARDCFGLLLFLPIEVLNTEITL